MIASASNASIVSTRVSLAWMSNLIENTASDANSLLPESKQAMFLLRSNSQSNSANSNKTVKNATNLQGLDILCVQKKA